MNIDKYFAEHYEEILSWATNIYGSTEIDARDVTSELYLDMNVPGRKLPTKESQFKFYILRWLHNMKYWNGRVRKYDIKDREFQDWMTNDKGFYEIEPNELNRDLTNAGFNPDQTERIIECINISKKMPLYYKRLFVLYYLDGWTYEQIGISCGLPKSTILRQMRKINEILLRKMDLSKQKALFK